MRLCLTTYQHNLALLEEKNPLMSFFVGKKEGIFKNSARVGYKSLDIVEKTCYVIYKLSCIQDLKKLLQILELSQVIVFESSEEDVLFHLSRSELTPLLKHPSFEWYLMQQLSEPLCLKLSWQSLFLKKVFISFDEDKSFLDLEKTLSGYMEGVFLTASEYKDFGKAVIKNICCNLPSFYESKNGRDLVLQNIPAIICGAGPSLIAEIDLLKQAHQKALIFAGGSAIDPLIQRGVQVHLGAAVDPNSPLNRFEDLSSKLIGFFYSLRVSCQLLKKIECPKIVIPGSGESLLEGALWKIVEKSEVSDPSGWNVANFIATLAAKMGCNPIIFVGMDMCYQESKEYVQGVKEEEREKKLEDIVEDGIKKESRKDLLMGRDYFSELVREYPERCWINATLGGLSIEGMDKKTLESALSELVYKKELKQDLENKIRSLVKIGNKKEIESFYKQLQKSFVETKECIATLLAKLEKTHQCTSLEEVEIESQLVYQLILERLWEVWRFVYFTNQQEKQKTMDGKIKKYLFFMQILKELEQGIKEDVTRV